MGSQKYFANVSGYYFTVIVKVLPLLGLVDGARLKGNPGELPAHSEESLYFPSGGSVSLAGGSRIPTY